MPQERLDRQLRIEGWDQDVLAEGKIGIVGDDDLLVSFYIASASALGINNLIVIAPGIDQNLRKVAQKVNPDLKLTFIEGLYTHNMMEEMLGRCKAIIDLSHFAIANKLLLEKSHRENVPVIRALNVAQNGDAGFKVFTYMKGREWAELNQVLSPLNLPSRHFDDSVLDIIASGIALEETKNILMGLRPSEEVIAYARHKLRRTGHNPSIGVIGAGALGNFVGLGLALSGFRDIAFFDPDIIEVTNLNRQVLFYDSVGMKKAEALSGRLNRLFGIDAKARTEYVRRGTDLSRYDVIFDCVDNFETRIIISEKCKEQKKLLISGGTSVDAGQAVVFDPAGDGATPAELLGLYDIVDKRNVDEYERERASCTYTPDPSVIMTNQIIAGLMVDLYRRILDEQEVSNIFYDAKRDKRF